eukprot:g1878.t1
MKTTDTSILGHLGTKYLSATAYSDLWTSSTGVFISGHILGVFCSQAFGAATAQEKEVKETALKAGKSKAVAESEAKASSMRVFKLVGIWANVGFVVLSCIGILVAVTWFLTSPVLGLFGVESSLRAKAAYFAVVLASCIPARTSASCISQFFQSQNIMHPSVFAGVVAMLCNLILGVVLVLGIPFKATKLGFLACPVITSFNEYLQLAIYIIVFVLARRLHDKCWPRFLWEHITRRRVEQFVDMYLPAALSIGSDFWRFSVIGILASKMSSDDLAVFNSSYRILWIGLTLIGSVASAVGIKLGQNLGAKAVPRAKRVTLIGVSIAGGMASLLGLVVLSAPRLLGSIFSSDKSVLDKYEKIRIPFATLAVFMNLAVTLERIPMAMGRTREVFIAGFLGSWVVQVPAVVLCTQLWRHDLVGLYTGVTIGYSFLCVVLCYIIANTDWVRISDEAVQRSQIKVPEERRRGAAASSVDIAAEEEEEKGSLFMFSAACFVYTRLVKTFFALISSGVASLRRRAIGGGNGKGGRLDRPLLSE